MTDCEAAVEEFLVASDAAFEEYDQGYADADATLRLIRRHTEDLRERVED